MGEAGSSTRTSSRRGRHSRATRKTRPIGRKKTLKMYCRCGQKVRITFPTPKSTGKCPKCGHKFKLPEYEES